MSDNNLNTHSEEELAELVFDIPLQDLSAYQLDKLAELNKLINKAVLEGYRNGYIDGASEKKQLTKTTKRAKFIEEFGVDSRELSNQLRKELSNEK